LEPTNPKKRSLMPSGPLRRALRAAGHHLDPVVQVGKEGLTDAVRAALDAQLLAHELVKVKVGGESPEDRFEVAARLSEGAAAAVAQILGRTMLVYRRHPEKPRFEPWGAGEAPPPKAEPDLPARRRGRHRASSRKGGTRGGVRPPRVEQRPGHYKRQPDDARAPKPRSEERPGNFGKRPPPRGPKGAARPGGRPPRGEKPSGRDQRRSGGPKRPYVKRGR